MKTHHQRHARDTPFVEYRAECGRRSACVDIGQSEMVVCLHPAPDVQLSFKAGNLTA